MEIKIARSENLPVLPQIVNQVLKQADDPNASSVSLERIIERDPAITAKILRVANSAHYGGSQSPSIGRAISVLGMNTIRSLVVGVAYQQMISTKTTAMRFCKLQFWEHSLAVATAARILGKMKYPAKSEELYCAGMVHDVGLLILDRFMPNELNRAIAFADEECLQLHVAENEIYGFDHSAVGALLADKWSLSPTMLWAIKNHHEMNEEGDPDFLSTCIISAANTLAHQCGYRNNSFANNSDLHPEAAKAIDMPEKQLDVIRAVVMQEIQKATEAFQIK